MKFDAALEAAQAMQARGLAMEEILAQLRASGVTIIDSVKIIRRIENVDLGKAKEIIDSSDTWGDRRDADELIRGIAFQAALEEGAQLDPST